MSRLFPQTTLPSLATKRVLTVAAESPANLAAQINAQLAILAAEPQVGTLVLTLAGISYGAAGAGGRWMAALAIALEDGASQIEGYPINVPAGPGAFNKVAVVAVDGSADIAEQTPTLATASPPDGPTQGEQLQRAMNAFATQPGTSNAAFRQLDDAGANTGHRFGTFAVVTYTSTLI